MSNSTKLPQKFQARVPVVATLKIGEVESAGGKARPKKLDYMRICGASATAAGTYPDHPAYSDFNGRKPRELTIELPSDDPHVNLELVYAMAGRGAILCRGNGVDAERRQDPRGTVSADVPFQKLPDGTCGESCPFFKTGACKLASTLRFRIPAGTGEGTVATPLGSIVQFRSTSWNSGQDLLGAMEAIKSLTGGVLARIPLRLHMTEQSRRAITTNGRQATSFWTLGLSFPGDESELVAAVGKALKLKADMAAVSIPSLEDRLRAQPSDLLTDLPAEEALAVAAEFYPALPTRLPAEPAMPAADQPAAETEAQAPEPLAEAQPAAESKPAPADEGARPSQRAMIQRYASKIPGLDMAALTALLDKPPADGGWTQAQTKAFINTQMLPNSEKAFRDLGLVPAKGAA